MDVLGSSESQMTRAICLFSSGNLHSSAVPHYSIESEINRSIRIIRFEVGLCTLRSRWQVSLESLRGRTRVVAKKPLQRLWLFLIKP
jgi:hypothetical protein